jgi:hypothetical protein
VWQLDSPAAQALIRNAFEVVEIDLNSRWQAGYGTGDMRRDACLGFGGSVWVVGTYHFALRVSVGTFGTVPALTAASRRRNRSRQCR